MSKLSVNIIGHWVKISDSPCSQKYPDQLQFKKDGFYFGRMDPPGRFALWDVGSFEFISSLKVKISVANDAIVSYSISIQDDTVTFVDPEGCSFRYRRAALNSP